MRIKKRMRAGERKSISKFGAHFFGQRLMTAVSFKTVVMLLPVVALAFIGLASIEAFQHRGAIAELLGLGGSGVLMGMAAAPPLNDLTPDTKALVASMTKVEADLRAFITKSEAEIQANGKISNETKTSIEKTATDLAKLAARVLDIEQKGLGRRPGEDTIVKTIGQMVIESDQWKAMGGSNGKSRTGQINVGSLHTKTALVNATGQNQPLVPDYRVPGIVTPGLQRLTIRDLIPSIPVSSNLVQFVKESSFTNAAAPVTGGSPNSGENVAKAESALVFALDNAPVQTIAHWLPASRQILDDAPALGGYIDSRLRFGLKLKEEDQLLNGSGSGTNISGLRTEAAVYDDSRNSATDTRIDTIRRALTQIRRANYVPDGIVLNPVDWEAIQLTKDTTGQYVFSDPHGLTAPALWGKPVIDTESIPEGEFLVGAFGLGATIWDRQDATVEVSREHSDFFVKNMVAILCEERLALTVYRSDAFSSGAFQSS